MGTWQIMRTGVMAFALAASLAWAGNEGPTAPAGFSKIVLGSSGGFAGGGNGKAMTVDENGKIVTRNRGKQQDGNLKAEELEHLKKLVAAMDWKGVKALYNAGADMFMSDSAVTVDGEVRRTSVSEIRPKNVPKCLAALLDYLNALYESHKP